MTHVLTVLLTPYYCALSVTALAVGTVAHPGWWWVSGASNPRRNT